MNERQNCKALWVPLRCKNALYKCSPFSQFPFPLPPSDRTLLWRGGGSCDEQASSDGLLQKVRGHASPPSSSPTVCLPVCLSDCPSLSVRLCLSVCVSLSVCLSVSVCLCDSVCLSVSLSVSLPFSLSTSPHCIVVLLCVSCPCLFVLCC